VQSKKLGKYGIAFLTWKTVFLELCFFLLCFIPPLKAGLDWLYPPSAFNRQG